VWDVYHHIIDPHSLKSPRHIRAVWVVADTGLLADGLATALFFCPAATLAKSYNFAYAMVYDDYSLEHSDNFPATFFTDAE
jgi:thiamine biosynthesis lipoprotein